MSDNLKQASEEYADGVYFDLSPDNTQRDKIYNSAMFDFIAGATYQHEATIEKVIAEVKKLIGTSGVNDFVMANLITAIKEIKV